MTSFIRKYEKVDDCINSAVAGCGRCNPYIIPCKERKSILHNKQIITIRERTGRGI